MNRFSFVAATLALSLFCTPNVVSASDFLPQTPSEWMDFLEKQSINQEDYGNSDQNFVTDSLPLLKDSAQTPDPNVIKIMIDPGHANYYNPSTGCQWLLRKRYDLDTLQLLERRTGSPWCTSRLDKNIPRG